MMMLLFRGRMPYTLYPNKFTQQAEMSEHDLRVSPGRTYRYYREPLFSFGAGLTLTNWTLALASTPETVHSTTPQHAEQQHKEFELDQDRHDDGRPLTAPSCLRALATTGGSCEVGVRVSNTGAIAGDCVVMAFFRAQRTKSQWAARRALSPTPARAGKTALLTPMKQLFDYSRVKAVAAGAHVDISFNVSASSLAEVAEASGCVLESG